jgi:hypothetical protein
MGGCRHETAARDGCVTSCSALVAELFMTGMAMVPSQRAKAEMIIVICACQGVNVHKNQKC